MYRVKAFVDPESLTFVAKFFLVFAMSYTFVTGVAFYFIVGEWRTYAESSLSAIEGGSLATTTDTCTIMHCKYIQFDDVVIYRDDNDVFTDVKPEQDKLIAILNSVIVIPVKSKKSGVVFGMPISSLIKFYVNTVFILYIFLMVLSLVFLIRYLIRSNIKSLVNGACNTAGLHNKNMSMLAEQLHHELNTPLSVVKELCDKVFATITEASNCRVKGARAACVDCTVIDKYEEILTYKRIIDNNVRQAFVFIERMADVKQIRYSNGNKSIYDIVKATFDIMGVYNRSNYTYNIDESLKRYRIDHLSGLKNHELMNILVNHIKNSLEAGSSHIVVSMNKLVPHKMSEGDKAITKMINTLSKFSFGAFSSAAIVVLYKAMSNKGKHNMTINRVALIDNGSGIPDAFIDKIFNLNSSTKKKKGVIRGAGLYLNREILRESMGDLWLHKTSKAGTTFILDIPSEQIAPTQIQKKAV